METSNLSITQEIDMTHFEDMAQQNKSFLEGIKQQISQKKYELHAPGMHKSGIFNTQIAMRDLPDDNGMIFIKIFTYNLIFLLLIHSLKLIT